MLFSCAASMAAFSSGASAVSAASSGSYPNASVSSTTTLNCGPNVRNWSTRSCTFSVTCRSAAEVKLSRLVESVPKVLCA